MIDSIIKETKTLGERLVLGLGEEIYRWVRTSSCNRKKERAKIYKTQHPGILKKVKIKEIWINWKF